ncbi:MAG: hypothetical protein WDW38_010746 [Sanguina aurantia]
MMMTTRASSTVAAPRISGANLGSARVSRVRSVVVRAEGGINPATRKSEEKVVDMLKQSELPKKAVFCRCWRSDKFPYCNASHVKHNAATGDNVGPLIIERDAVVVAEV